MAVYEGDQAERGGRDGGHSCGDPVRAVHAVHGIGQSNQPQDGYGVVHRCPNEQAEAHAGTDYATGGEHLNEQADASAQSGSVVPDAQSKYHKRSACQPKGTLVDLSDEHIAYYRG